MASNIEVATGIYSGTFEKIGTFGWLFGVIICLSILGIIAYLAINYQKSKKSWNVVIRVRQENTLNNTIYIDPISIKARVIKLNNGLNMFCLQKPLMGKLLMPLLNYYTKPGVYDIIVTKDRRIFITTGIVGIDKERKLLKVGTRYPGIDNDFEELNNSYADLNQQNKAFTLMDYIKAASTGIAAICLLIAVIVGGKYWLEGQESRATIEQSQIEIFEQLKIASDNNVQFANSMNLLIPKLKDIYGNNNLQSEIQKINKGNNSI